MSVCVYLVYEAGNFRTALELCASLKPLRGPAAILFSPYYLPETETYVRQAAAAGLHYVHEATALGGAADPVGQLARAGFAVLSASPSALPLPRLPWHGRLRRGAAAGLLFGQRREWEGWEDHYRARIDVARKFLHSVGASTVIFPEDNVERDSACWVAAAHERNARAVVVSYGALSRHEAAIAYYDQPDYRASGLLDAAFLTLYPKWRLSFRDHTMVRLPVQRAYAMERLGLAPRDPWIVNTGTIDVVVVESEFMRRQYIDHGVAPGKVAAIGTQSLDALAQSSALRDTRRAELAGRKGWPRSRPILLCAVPPNQYPSVVSPESDSYRALLKLWADALATVTDRFNVVVSPHPSIQAADLQPLREAGFEIVGDGAAYWLPLCDLFMASVSSTIKWALACGKPVLNYDCYQYRHTDYRGIAQVVEAMTQQEACAALSQFADTTFLHTMSQQAESQKEMYGVLDGRSGERFAALLSEKP